MKQQPIYKICYGLLSVIMAACAGSDKEIPQEPDQSIVAVEAFPAVKFTAPVDITHAGDGTNRLFIAEQAGLIKVVENETGTTAASTFLDIRSKVAAGGERGLLGLAFHPEYKTNGYFYVNYTRGNPLTTVIARYRANTPSANFAESSSETILLTFSQPYENHNGGSLQFGKDGYLYVAAGDGGSGGDPQNNAQNRKSMLGKILRLDVNGTSKGNYGIPADNPFADSPEIYNPEIYALGLRNPWKISFDMETGQLVAADVGQNAREEINLITKGGNYGWKIKEGIDCYSPSSNCNTTGLTEPIFDYNQSRGDKSITGGYVYRGSELPSLAGKYIYGDYVSGRIWALEINNGKAGNNSLLVGSAGSVSTFGQDAKGEVYFANYSSGKIMKLGKN